VLNESMNSGCAVVASRAIGAVPFLVEDNGNGMIYPSCNVDALFGKVKTLLEDPDQQRKLGAAAYETMTEVWNGEVAAQRLCRLIEELLQNGKPNLYKTGPCSRVG